MSEPNSSLLINKLNQETSPYLLQHAHNPVAWQAWNEQTFALARELKRPIFLSIGYSTCYWCHVMEKDSFETQEVAKVLNEKFVPIKVDREERPDVDQRYMQAVVALTGHGGWPMSVFLTPELKPFWGATFFYKDQFITILEQINEAWTQKLEKVETAASQLSSMILEIESREGEGLKEITTTKQSHIRAYEARWDFTFGGPQGAPRFPPSPFLKFLIAEYQISPTVDSKHMLSSILDGMAKGGIFDQLGGGFSRYSVDGTWTVPHFEKMLYDNVQLAEIYSEASLVLDQPAYAQVAAETYEFLFRELSDPHAAFFSALDAGEVDKEGEYYLWNYAELQKCLSPEQLKLLEQVCEVSSEGNFEGKIVLRLRPESELSERDKLKEIFSILSRQRNLRERPHRDEKIILSWNALGISSLCKASRSLQDSKYLETAKRIFDLQMERLSSRNTSGLSDLKRCFSKAKASIAAQAEDYAYFIAAALDLFQAGGGVRYLTLAQELQGKYSSDFWKKEGYFVDTAAQELSPKPAEYEDHVTPATQAVSLENLWRLSQFYADSKAEAQISHLTTWISKQLSEPAMMGSSTLRILGTIEKKRALIYLSTNAPENWERELMSKPSLGYLRLTKEHAQIQSLKKKAESTEACAWVCRANQCSMPAKTLEEFRKLLAEP